MIEFKKYDWKNLAAAKDATEIPKAIKDLAKAKSTVEAEKIRAKFEYNLFYNEDVYEAAVPAINCILSFINDASAHGRAEAFSMLYDLGAGYADFEEHQYIDSAEAALQKRCRKAVENGISQYFYFFENGSDLDRLNLTDLLELCSREDGEIRNRAIWFIQHFERNCENLKLSKVYHRNLRELSLHHQTRRNPQCDSSRSEAE